MFVVSLRMNARVLSVLFESISAVEGERGGVCFGGARFLLLFFWLERAPPLCPEVELQLPHFFRTRGRSFCFSAAIKCAMYYVACLKKKKKHTRYKKLILLSIV